MFVLTRFTNVLAPLMRARTRPYRPRQLRGRGLNALLTGALALGGFGLAWILVASEFGATRQGYCEYRTFRDPVTGRETRGPTIICIGPDKLVVHR